MQELFFFVDEGEGSGLITFSMCIRMCQSWFFLFVRFDLFVFVSQEVSDLHRHIFVWEIIFLISFFASIPEV